jgi:hypothetical protein
MENKTKYNKVQAHNAPIKKPYHGYAPRYGLITLQCIVQSEAVFHYHIIELSHYHISYLQA